MASGRSASAISAAERLSRRLAHALRHAPAEHGLVLAPGGWARIDDVVRALGISRDELHAMVEAPGRRRFEQRGELVRACHGHSIAIELDHPQEVPPERLFHGTIASRLEAIRAEGLRPQRRQHVHLTSSPAEAITIGARHGAPIVIEVRALALHQRGSAFLHVPHSVIWLVDHVPADHLVIPEVG